MTDECCTVVDTGLLLCKTYYFCSSRGVQLHDMPWRNQHEKRCIAVVETGDFLSSSCATFPMNGYTTTWEGPY